MSVGVRIIFLVEDDSIMYIMVTVHRQRDGLSHYQNLTSLSTFDSILKRFFFFWIPMLVGVRVILSVEYGKTMYIHPYIELRTL
jgi:hypothetical protein